MTTIRKATPADAVLLSAMAQQSFIESHGHSAPAADIEQYVQEKYNSVVMEAELGNEKNNYHIIYIHEKPAGFSNIIFNTPYNNSATSHIAKLERIYLLKDFYGSGAGNSLFDWNTGLAKAARQSAIWLYVWKENERAVRFYQKKGFVIVGSHDFRISPTHTNPNYQMLLEW